ncbi:MAG: class I SAM-dependent methyltransferase [Anaerolineae bacterium]|nr:class I SAM-dependent methyltransferase [Anaerolineae bacterium]
MNTARKFLVGLLNLFGAWSKRHSRKGLYEYLTSQLASVASGTLLLNVGAGGEVSSRIHSILAAGGIEVQLFSIDIAPTRNPDVVCDVCHVPFPENSFERVFLMEVLEHVYDPAQALAEIYRVLKPGGVLIFSVPFVFPLHDRPFDYFRFTKHGIELLLRNYDQVNIVERNNYGETISVLMMRLLMEKSHKAKLLAMTFMLSGAIPLFALLGRLVDSDAITSGYVGSAKKHEYPMTNGS